MRSGSSSYRARKRRCSAGRVRGIPSSVSRPPTGLALPGDAFGQEDFEQGLIRHVLFVCRA